MISCRTAACVVFISLASTVFSLPTCDGVYPISGTPLFDFDVNCFIYWPYGAGNSNWSWVSKVNNVVMQNHSMPITARTFDTTRNLYRLVISSGQKVKIPFNTGPTAYPNLTIEALVSVGSVTTNGGWSPLIRCFRKITFHQA